MGHLRRVALLFLSHKIRTKLRVARIDTMLHLQLGQTAQYLVVTLNEKRTLSSGYYLFIFEHITTRDQVAKVYGFGEDESSYPDRYNKFSIDTQTLFGTKPTGEYRYTVYESATATRNPAGLTEVERGLMRLAPAAAFGFEAYDGATSFKQYGG